MTLIWPLLPVQTGSQSFTICDEVIRYRISLKNHISTTARGKFTIFAPLYRSLIVKKYLQKSDPIWPLLPVQTGSQSLLFKKIISQQPQEVNSQFLHHCTDRCLSKNIDKKVTLIWPLLPVQTGSQSWISLKNHISQQPQEVNSKFLHHCTDR